MRRAPSAPRTIIDPECSRRVRTASKRGSPAEEEEKAAASGWERKRPSASRM
jgi:hypothetical protein